MMSGGEALIRTFAAGGVDVWFANPGTSEIDIVAAFDCIEHLRTVLCLFEGVATGAADGYFRMVGRPAATLLHLGPGLANGLANLHNARRAHSAIINVVGNHATYHVECDSPLTTDIEGLARSVSKWVFTVPDSGVLSASCAEAIGIACSPPGQIATLIVPADIMWSSVDCIAPPQVEKLAAGVPDANVKQAASALLSGPRALLLLGGAALREKTLELAGRIAARTGCKVMAECHNARIERGAGRVQVNRVPYDGNAAVDALKEFEELVLVGAQIPVAFFAHPGQPNVLIPSNCSVATLARVEDDLHGALASLAEELDALSSKPILLAQRNRSGMPTGKVTLDGIGAVLAALLPEAAIVVDESISSGRALVAQTASAAPHDWTNIVGGAIGYGLPVAIGAAIACPARRVFALEGDGSAMYTLQSLWTMARENLNVTILIFANRAYRILQSELLAAGVNNPGTHANNVLSLDKPTLDWVELARGLGVEAQRAFTLEEVANQIRRALSSEGPYLIEIVV